MFRNGWKFAVLAGLLLLVTPLFANNLIFNGNFTTYNGNTPVAITASDVCGLYGNCYGYYYQAGHDFIGPSDNWNTTDWVLTSPAALPPSGMAVVMALGANYTEPEFNQQGQQIGILNFNPLAGTQQSLDLTGEGNMADYGFYGVKQDVTTTPGQWYDLSFYLGHQCGQAAGYGLNGGGAAALTLAIDLGNGTSLSQGFSNNLNDVTSTGCNVSWALENYRFEAASGETTIAFLNASGSQDQRFVGLDGVSLSVPEPATFVLLVTGLAGMLLLLSRRQKVSWFLARAAKRG